MDETYTLRSLALGLEALDPAVQALWSFAALGARVVTAGEQRQAADAMSEELMAGTRWRVEHDPCAASRGAAGRPGHRPTDDDEYGIEDEHHQR
jgi:hypothetical protein